jgi:hypothetical protein
MGLEASVYYLGMGLMTLRPGEADSMQLGSFPSVGDMLRKAQDMGVIIYACEASKQMLGWEKVDLLPGLKIVGAGTLNDLSLEADATEWF